MILDMIKEKWLNGKKYVELPENTNHTEEDIEKISEVLGKYLGHIIFRAEVLYIYGEWEITIRVGKVEKIANDFFEAPINAIRIDHLENAQQLAKKIKLSKKPLLEE